ncbi:MAG: isoleucine--tRNA ligase [Acidobacteria bacterium]|nr:MAG: isoleucine--tRNA ligase [Acidobacteriota bacterium]
MFKTISDKVRLPDLEKEILAYWKTHRIFEKSVEGRHNAADYTFYEGPPTANGKPGIHHVFARTIKDLVCRYQTMRGYQVHRKAGWDTHGLPVEIEVEKKLGLKHKGEIEKYGIAKFNAECRKSVFEYKDMWEDLTWRMGYWIDMEHPYITCENEYIESVWWALDRYFKEGLIYQGFKVQLYCPRCGTPLSSHEVSLGYREVQDPSVYIKAKVKGEANTYFLVWTTTPWTLISNVALAVNPNVEYVKVRFKNDFLILAKERLSVIAEGAEVVVTMPGRDLIGKEYERWFSFIPVDKKGWYVVGGDFVTTSDGSGIVHMAPAYGEDDYQASLKYDLPMIQALDARGQFTEAVPPYAGKFFKDADPEIMADLKSRGLLFKKETYTHSYPHCWRCDTALLYYARKSWYIRTTDYAKDMIAFNKQIHWYPPETGEGRFGNWLEENKDWALSRDRYWGTPLPIWVCEQCEAKRSVGSVEELRREGAKLPEPLDLHRPYIDEVTLKCSCGGEMRRIPELADVWFDSGSMPFAQWHYPFENQETFKHAFPADFISEAIDQTRGWFYTLHAISSFLFKGPCFKNVICSDLVLDKTGQKMSKSRGNTVDPFEVIDKHSADSVRWFLIASSPTWKPKLFDVDAIAEVQRKFFGTLLNTYAFFALYANIDGFTHKEPDVAVSERPEIDRWILSLLNTTIGSYIEAMESYDPTRAARLVSNFTIEQLSNWYVRRNRRRFWKSEPGRDKTAAYQTLFECLVAITKMAAPIAPFVPDEIYRALMSETRRERFESVHTAKMVESRRELIRPELEHRMDVVQRIVGLVRSMRQKTSLKTRQPLLRIAIPASEETRLLIEQMNDVILEEINVKAIEFIDESSPIVRKTATANFKIIGPKFGKMVNAVAKRIKEMLPAEVVQLDQTGFFATEINGSAITITREDVAIAAQSIEGWLVESGDGLTVALDTKLTPELINEGLAREFVNRVQNMRKDAGFEVTDRIRIHFEAPSRVAEAVQRLSDYIKSETLATQVTAGRDSAEHWEKWDIDGEPCEIGISKA